MGLKVLGGPVNKHLISLILWGPTIKSLRLTMLTDCLVDNL